MTLKAQLDADLPTFVNPDEFADEATIVGIADPVPGLFDPGTQDGREPRSPAFTCIDAAIASISHGVQITIKGVPYWLEGYNPDGVGMATLILRPE